MNEETTLLDQLERREINPFWTVEALREHVGSAQYAVNANLGQKEIHYHLKAIDDAAYRLFEMLVALLPELRKAEDGEAVDNVLPPNARERFAEYMKRYER